uniref:ARID domain-containing protein n=1 Tax=Spongospora subterranea TaxID=70186 RepID=A0A0H5RNK5_9EUKA|eukprot:CRZ10304.1 hypothetical protein [Spongospora subterranea]
MSSVCTDNLYEIDGFAIEEFSAPPPTLPSRESWNDSTFLPPLRAAELPQTRARPPLIQCDHCRKWRQVDFTDGELAALPSQWVCEDGGCVVGQDDWALKSSRVVPYVTMILPRRKPKPLKIRLNRQQGVVVAVNSHPVSPLDTLNSSRVELDAPAVGWLIPEEFIETEDRGHWYSNLQSALYNHGKLSRNFPRLGAREVDLYALYHEVQRLGGFTTVCDDKLWKDVGSRLNIPVPSNKIRICYLRYLDVLSPVDLQDSGLSTPDVDATPIVLRKRPRVSITTNEEPSGFDANSCDVNQIAERLAKLEQAVETIIQTQRLMRVDLLCEIRDRVASLSQDVTEYSQIMRDSLPNVNKSRPNASAR